MRCLTSCKLYLYSLLMISVHFITIVNYYSDTINENDLEKLTQVSSVSQSRLTVCDPCSQASLSITNSRSLLKFMSIESVMPSNHLILCHPLLLLPSILSSIRVYSSESVLCIRWPKYWSFSFRISPSNGYSGLISFMMDGLDLLAVQRTVKSLLQHHS